MQILVQIGLMVLLSDYIVTERWRFLLEVTVPVVLKRLAQSPLERSIATG